MIFTSPANLDWEEAEEDLTSSSENEEGAEFANNGNPTNDISMKDISVIDENSLRLLDDIYDQVTLQHKQLKIPPDSKFAE